MSEAASTPGPKPGGGFYQPQGRPDGDEVDFAPVQGRQNRPWDPEWFVYELARRRFVNHTQRCLDLGCGEGVAAVRLAYLGYHVDGIDLSDADLQLARRLVKRYNLESRCAFARMSPQQLDYPAATFDLIVGLDVLEFMDVAAVAGQVHRTLKPGGAAVFKCCVESPTRSTETEIVGKTPAALIQSVVQSQHRRRERQLTGEDLRLIHNQFTQVEIKRFTIFNRLGRLMAATVRRRPDQLQRSDDDLIRLCPPLADLNDTAVIICQK